MITITIDTGYEVFDFNLPDLEALDMIKQSWHDRGLAEHYKILKVSGGRSEHININS